jgi:hypothetical protein
MAKAQAVSIAFIIQTYTMKYFATILLAALVLSCGNNNGGTTAPVADNKTTATTAPETASEATSRGADPAPAASFTCQLNGQAWKAGNIFNGHLFYAKGISAMFGGNPYMMLAFRAVDNPDNRQLTISFKNFQGKTGVYAKEKIEVMLSGAASGEAQKSEMQGHKVPGQNTDFTVELTDWKPVKDDEALVSGKVQGTLKGIFGTPDVKIEGGSFANVPVKVFNEKY